MSRLARTRVGGLLALVALAGVGGAQAWGQEDRGQLVVADPRISESSALAVSPSDPSLLYTVNDSGHDPVVYTVDRASGDVVGTTTLLGLDPDTLDTEALTVDVDGRLWVADTGDNYHRRDDQALYALPAPGRGDRQVTAQRYPLDYPAGNPDVEALLTDPVDGRLLLVTKGLVGGQVLGLPVAPPQGQTLAPDLVRGLRVPGMVTDATALPATRGRDPAAVLRTYGSAYVYRLPGWQTVGQFALPRQQQGESLTALAGGRRLLAGSEGSPALIDHVVVPAAVRDGLAQPADRSDDPDGSGAAGSATPTTGPTSDEGTGTGTGPDGALPTGPLVAALSAGALLVLAGSALVLRARCHSVDHRADHRADLGADHGADR